MAVPGTNQPSPAAINAASRTLVKQQALRMQQPIFSQTFADNTTTPVITVNPRNVGLILGFYVSVQFTVTNTGGGPTLTPTDFSSANIFTNISFTDLNNNVRINTNGLHVAMLDGIKARRPYGAALVAVTGEDSPIGYGSVYTVSNAPAIPTGQNKVWNYVYWVPLAYSEDDLRGAVYANVVNATMQLNFTFNATPLAAAPTNDLNYLATGTTGTVTSITVNVDQVYLDQLPKGQGGALILPLIDLSTVYELKSTSYNGLSANTEFPVDYSNFRDYLSTFAIYFNGAARVAGTDVSYFSLVSANFTQIWKQRAQLIALKTRNHLQVDTPKGCYYFGSRQKPISTLQYGNMQLVLNPITAGAGNQLYILYEDFAFQNQLVGNTGAGAIGG